MKNLNGAGRRLLDTVRGFTVAQRTSPRCEVRGAVRRRENAHGMAPVAEPLGDPGHVLVHVVRLRPREGGHQADSQGHGATESSPVL